jgi:hypothetical protein
MLCKITRVDARKKPPLFFLETLNKKPVIGSFYKEQLTLAPKPEKNDFYTVEEKLKTEIDPKTGRKRHFVKFLDYPSEYNRWVDDKDYIDNTTDRTNEIRQKIAADKAKKAEEKAKNADEKAKKAALKRKKPAKK